MLRKKLIGLIFVLLLTCSSFGQEKIEGWTYLDGGQSSSGVEFRKDGTVFYQGKLLMGCPYSENEMEGSSITISEPSKLKGLVIVQCSGKMYLAESSAVIIDTKNKLVITKDIVPKDWQMTQWYNWSPDERYLLFSFVGELADVIFAVVDVQKGTTRELKFKSFALMNERRKIYETNYFEPNSIIWTNVNTFQVKLSVVCNEYVAENCDPRKILRSNNAQVNSATLAVTYGTPRIMTTQTRNKPVIGQTTVAQNVNLPIRKIDFKNATFKNVGLGKRTVIFRNGVSSEISKDVDFFEDSEVNTEITLITFVDFDKDRNDEVVIKVSSRVELKASAYWEEDYFVSAYKDGKLTQIFHETRYKPKSFEVQGNKLVMKASVAAENDPNCCPSLTETSVYEWQNGKFILLSKTVLPTNQKTTTKATTTPNTATQSSIRKVDFRNFTYTNVKHPDDALLDITVSKGKYIKGDQGSYNSWDFVINEVIYGDITNDGQEDALIRATLTTYGSSNPASLDSAYFFLYTSENGTPTRIMDFDVWKDYEPFSNFQNGCEELILGAKIKAVSTGKATLNLLITGIECPHKGFTITSNYTWKDNKMILVGKPIKTRTR